MDVLSCPSWKKQKNCRPRCQLTLRVADLRYLDFFYISIHSPVVYHMQTIYAFAFHTVYLAFWRKFCEKMLCSVSTLCLWSEWGKTLCTVLSHFCLEISNLRVTRCWVFVKQVNWSFIFCCIMLVYFELPLLMSSGNSSRSPFRRCRWLAKH